MAGFQQTFIIGNLTADPEMRYTPSGAAVCSFRVAVDRQWTDRTTNERMKKTTYFRVSAWRQLAELCNEYLSKGRQVMVTGEVEASAFVGDDGEARASLDLTAREVQFLGSREDAREPAQIGRDPSDLPF